MDLGTAIKTIRKQKNISQKALAEGCGMSVNALCQIELNNTFPQKSTIKKICTIMDIPPSYLLFFSLSEDDVPPEKRQVFKTLSTAIRDVLFDDVSLSNTSKK